VIIVYKVINRDIFLTKTHCFASETLYWITFMMDGCAFLGASKSQAPFTPIIKLGRARIFF